MLKRKQTMVPNYWSNCVSPCQPLYFINTPKYKDNKWFSSKSHKTSSWQSSDRNLSSWFWRSVFLPHSLPTYGPWVGYISSVQFSCTAVSDSLRPHEPQHTRPPCPSPTPGVYPNSCPFSWWCHLTVSSSVVPFSLCPQSFPASGSFQMSQFFSSGGPSIGVSTSHQSFQWTPRTDLL